MDFWHIMALQGTADSRMCVWLLLWNFKHFFFFLTVIVPVWLLYWFAQNPNLASAKVSGVYHVSSLKKKKKWILRPLNVHQ